MPDAYDDWPTDIPGAAARVLIDKEPLLSVCMIVRNEEATLAMALDSLHYDRPDPQGMKPNADGKFPIWDELIIVLAGESTDSTELIAKTYGAKVGFFPVPDGKWPTDAAGKELRHYGEAREATEGLARGKYVLWIDGDERLVEGHEVIRKVVENGMLPGVRPRIRALNGLEHTRQELLHRRGKYHWKGAIHERLEGFPTPVERRIVYEEIARPDGDRPHGDMFDLLRRDMGTTLQTRQLYYIAREHLNEEQWAQAIAVGRLFLESGGGWPEQRSQMCIFLAQAWIMLGDQYHARLAYLDAIKEFGAWAEPYYGLAVLHRDLGLYLEAVMWASASLVPSFKGDGDTQAEASNEELYTWRRLDVMAYCLAQIGHYEQATHYYELVSRAHPNHATDANLRRCRDMARKVPA